MKENSKNNELRDYLFMMLQEMTSDEEERKILSEYALELVEKFKPFLNFTEKENSRHLLAQSLSQLVEDKNVKRNT